MSGGSEERLNVTAPNERRRRRRDRVAGKREGETERGADREGVRGGSIRHGKVDEREK